MLSESATCMKPKNFSQTRDSVCSSIVHDESLDDIVSASGGGYNAWRTLPTTAESYKEDLQQALKRSWLQNGYG